MDIKKFCLDPSNFEDPLGDIPEVYLPCPHKLYKSEVIHRNNLTHEQYIDLLSTPRGFKWNKHTGLAYPKNGNGRSIEYDECGTRGPLCSTDFRYLGDFITDIWNVMTPRYRKKMKNLLMKVYGMSEKEAEEFLAEQELRSAFSNNHVESRFYLSARHDWVKEVADVLAGKLTDYLAVMLRARRTPKVRGVAEAILKSFSDFTGEKCSLEDPSNRLQNMQVFAADRLAVWLSQVLGDYDQELCREDLKVSDEAYQDSDESSEETDYEDESSEGEDQSPDKGTASETKSPDAKSQTKDKDKNQGKNPKGNPGANDGKGVSVDNRKTKN